MTAIWAAPGLDLWGAPEEAEALAKREIVMLGEAALCASCSAISKATHGRCLRCDSRNVMALEPILNRKRE